MVNVLQAVILTEGDKMVKTPTYHVMHMFRHHQDGQLLSSSLTGVEGAGTGENIVPKLTESVSVNAEGIITVTVGNLSDCTEEKLTVQLEEGGYQVVEARIVSGPAIQSHNTFEDPDVVSEKAFDGYTATDCGIEMVLPAASVVEGTAEKMKIICKKCFSRCAGGEITRR